MFGNFTAGGLTTGGNCARFQPKATTKTRAPVRFPERLPPWWKTAVPLLCAQPLPSRRAEMLCRVRPLRRQWVAFLWKATRVEPWNTACYCIPPLIFQGVGFFIPSPRMN